MTGKAWGNVYRTTTVCVDSYENGVLSGRFYNPYLEKGKAFQSLTQFLLEMDRVLDTMEFPKSFTTTRTFSSVPEMRAQLSETDVQSGKLATFAVRILFRQNSSWQGSVLWVEGQREQSFRSVLELIFLMDSALSPQDEV